MCIRDRFGSLVTDSSIREIDSHTLGTRCTRDMGLSMITDNDIFAVGFSNTTAMLETYRLDSSGNISDKLGSANMGNRTVFKDVIKMNDGLIIVGVVTTFGHLQTITMNSAGALTRVNFTDTANASDIQIVKHDDDTVLAVSGYTGTRLFSFDINLVNNRATKNSASINIASHSTGIGIVKPNNNAVMLGYVGDARGGAILKTYTVTNTNTFLTGFSKQIDVNSTNLTVANGGRWNFEYLADNRITVAHPGQNANGQIYTITIDGTNGIQEVADSRLTFSTDAKYIAMVRDGSKTVLAYSGLDSDGYLALIKPPEVAPSAGTLSAHSLSDSSIRFSYIPGASGTEIPNSFDLRCKESTQNQWRAVREMAPIPSGNIYVVSGLLNDVTLECQWRQNSDHGKGEWSNTASATTVRPQYQDPPVTSGPIKAFEQAINNFGGIYFGLSLFPFLVMLFGAMATAKTTGIFTIITLMLMGIIHASGYYEWPEWYWALMTLFAIPLVLSARRG